jgi:FKBP-type peptidyl-prolyl cis-trans isomerase
MDEKSTKIQKKNVEQGIFIKFLLNKPLVLFVIFLLIVVVSLNLFKKEDDTSEKTEVSDFVDLQQENINDINEDDMIYSVADLEIEDLVVGSGEESKNGDTLTVHYTGYLTNGEVFDTSAERGPFSFVLGQGRVIEGWEKGMLGMRVGGKRKLTIPSEMGYGTMAIGNIPANSTLIFEVELLQIN